MRREGRQVIQQQKWWLHFLFGGACAIVGYYVVTLVASSSLPSDLVSLLFPLAAMVGVVAGVVMYRPASRLPWLLVVTSQGANFLGDLTWTIQHSVFHQNPYPGPADFFYLLAYPFLGLGLLMFVRRRTPESNTPALLDSVILSLAVGLLWWLYVIRPLTFGDGTVFERTISVAYPLMDVLVLAVAMRLTVGVGTRTRSFALLVGSLLVMLLADMVYALLSARNLYSDDDIWMDWTWFVSYLLIGAAALHPSMRSLDARAAVVVRGASRGRLTVLTLAGLFPMALLLARYAAGGKLGLGVPEIAAASAALFVLMVVRLRGLADVHERLAIHDGLTGAYSRRFLGEAFRSECTRAQTGRTDLAIALVDLDNFALVNEMYGNVSGDLLLAAVAARMHGSVRPGDMVGRDDGDRFLVIMPGIDARDALIVTERIRASVSEDRIVTGNGDSVRATVSAGVAVMSRDGRTPQALMRAADQALYAAKRAGRNRTYTTYGPVNLEAFVPAQPMVTESSGGYSTPNSR